MEKQILDNIEIRGKISDVQKFIEKIELYKKDVDTLSEIENIVKQNIIKVRCIDFEPNSIKHMYDINNIGEQLVSLILDKNTRR